MSTSKAFRILSVEDNPETQLLLRYQLQDSYEVAFASGVDEAVNLVETEDFDLLLLDINLGPGKSGAQLLHILRNREDTTEIPAIALTAYAMPGDQEHYLEMGFDGYVGKPFTHAELTATIDRTLSAT